MTLAVLIPAAGCSSRLGHSKQLIKVYDRPLLQNRIRLCAQALNKTNGKIYCVLGANAHQIRHHVIDPRCRFLFFEQWQKGLAHTIAYGISHLPSPVSAALIMLSDQWAIKEADINQLIKLHQQHPTKIIVSQYEHTKGVPAIFPRQYFQRLINIDSNSGKDIGAKKIIQEYRDQVITLRLDNAKYDLDTPEQLLKMRQQLQSSQTE